MKKFLIISIVFALFAMLTITTVNAVSGATIVEDIYNLGKKYGVTEADKVRGERYIADNPMTDEQAQAIYEKALEGVKILEKAGVTDVKKLDKQLTKEQKKEFEAICQEAAKIINLSLIYNNGVVDVYKDGKKIDTYTFTDNGLVYTGNRTYLFIVIPVVAVIALTTVYIVKKRVNE